MASVSEEHQLSVTQANRCALQRQQSGSSDAEQQSSSCDTEVDEIILSCIVGALDDCDEDFNSSHRCIEKTKSLDDTDSNESSSNSSGVVSFVSAPVRGKKLIRPLPSPRSDRVATLIGFDEPRMNSNADESFVSSCGSSIVHDKQSQIDVVPDFCGGYKQAISQHEANQLREPSDEGDVIERCHKRPRIGEISNLMTLNFSTFGRRRSVSPWSGCSSNDNSDLENCLVEELVHCTQTDNLITAEGRVKSLVPLLTPPASPLTVVFDNGVSTICEWPSNMVVECALQAATELRPLSPASLQILEIDEQDRVGFSFLTS